MTFKRFYLNFLKRYSRVKLESAWRLEEKIIELEHSMAPHTICSICQCKYDVEIEGGSTGHIGFVPANFCPDCYSGLSEHFSEPV